jgi:hypothetical protein
LPTQPIPARRRSALTAAPRVAAGNRMIAR